MSIRYWKCPLPAVDSVTDLGVSIYLQFGPHISHIVSKATLRAKPILKCFQSLDPGLLTRAFCTFVRPILEYCSVVWSPTLKRHIHKIETVQRRFTKRLNRSIICRIAVDLRVLAWIVCIVGVSNLI